MDERNNNFDFDFTPIGQAIKKSRVARGMTREQLANIVDYDIRHLQAIENEGQHPSFQLFAQLVTMFDISVDEYIFPNKEVNKSSVPHTGGQFTFVGCPAFLYKPVCAAFHSARFKISR